VTRSDRLAGAVARVLVTNARPLEQILDEAAALIGQDEGDLCLIGAGISGSTVLAPVGVYHREPDRLLRINETRAFAWPVSERASLVLASGNPAFSDGSTDSSELDRTELWGPWTEAVLEAGPFGYMMLAIRFAGVSVGMIAVGRRLPAEAFTRADAQNLEVVVDVLGLALRELQIPPGHTVAERIVPRVRRSAITTLNVRERRVVVLLADGLTNAEIGSDMYLSERTIEWYRARLLEKLDHPTRAELVALGRTFRD
jgi:DNA-binding CsgD family transcriptional regulator